MKLTLWGLGMALILLMLFLFKSESVKVDRDQRRNQVIQQNTVSRGYEEGKKTFEVVIQEMEMGRSNDDVAVTAIVDGRIYNNQGDTVVSNIQGDQGEVQTDTQSFRATENVKATVHMRQSSRTMDVQADALDYNHSEKRAEFSDLVYLTLDDVQVTTNAMAYHSDTGDMWFHDRTRIWNEQGSTEFHKGRIRTNQYELLTQHHIQSQYMPRDQSDQRMAQFTKEIIQIVAQHMTVDFENEDALMATYDGDVHAWQTDQFLMADSLHIDGRLKTYTAQGAVRLWFRHLHGTLTASSRQPVVDRLKTPTTTRSNYGQFNARTNQFELRGDVKVTQGDEILYCDHLLIDFTRNTVTARGSVQLNKYKIPRLITDVLVMDMITGDVTVGDGVSNSIMHTTLKKGRLK